MASSNPSLVPIIARWIWNIQPQTILDIGCGFGRYGVLCRDILEVCKQRYFKKDWKTRVDAVDIFGPFVATPLHEYIYDKILVADVRWLSIPEGYDLIIMGDIIEHLPKEDSLKLIEKLLDKCKYMLIQTPNGEMKSPVCFDNPAEEHISKWYPEDFSQYYPVIETNSNIFAVLIRGRM